ncbi:hypothetical protein Taro_019160 [Colocasia esculenta]|uniref:Uncharacterized protein n=1 Tax=Colocasia esculenta TaxID=4460 RepID=A0A843USM8_COLES|nr:hypothetical protein [Colocasia esculenta]
MSFSRGCLVSLGVTPGCSFPTSWRSGVFGVCVVRLWSHVVALVFRELLCLGGCVQRVASAFPAALTGKGLLFEFIAYLTGLNSNPFGSSDPWVAARPLGSLAGVREVGSLQLRPHA